MRRLLAKIKANKKGFTLLETLIALAVVGILSAVIVPLISNSLTFMQTSMTLREKANAASSALNSTECDTETVTIEVDIEVFDTEYNSWKWVKGSSTYTFSQYTESGDNDVQVTYKDIHYED